MKKKSKYGLNTGNRLMHFHNARFCRYCVDQCTIVKNIHCNSTSCSSATDQTNCTLKTTEDLVQDGDINGNISHNINLGELTQTDAWYRPDDLLYSLNKQKRWLLPEIIRFAIKKTREVHTTDELFPGRSKFVFSWHMSLLERKIQFNTGRSRSYSGIYAVINQRKCDSVAYCTSSGGRPHIVPKKTFASSSGLKSSAMQTEPIDAKVAAKARRREGHNQHFRNLQRKRKKSCLIKERIEQVEEQAKMPEISYEICYPQISSYVLFYRDNLYGAKLKSLKKRKGCKNKAKRDDGLTIRDAVQLAEFGMHYYDGCWDADFWD